MKLIRNEESDILSEKVKSSVKGQGEEPDEI